MASPVPSLSLAATGDRQTDRLTADLWKMSLFSRRGGAKKEEAKNRAEVSEKSYFDSPRIFLFCR